MYYVQYLRRSSGRRRVFSYWLMIDIYYRVYGGELKSVCLIEWIFVGSVVLKSYLAILKDISKASQLAQAISGQNISYMSSSTCRFGYNLLSSYFCNWRARYYFAQFIILAYYLSILSETGRFFIAIFLLFRRVFDRLTQNFEKFVSNGNIGDRIRFIIVYRIDNANVPEDLWITYIEFVISFINKMGNKFDNDEPSNTFDITRHSQLKKCNMRPNFLQVAISVNSEEEEQQMVNILRKRIANFSKNQYVCSIKQFDVEDGLESKSLLSRSCKYQTDITIRYNSINFRLSDIPLSKYPEIFNTNEIYNVICCLSQGLMAFRKANLYYGDIYMDNICKTGNKWQLIDKDFYKYGLSAYETVLQNQSAFITPSQMQRIRHGFIRESPIMEEADDIFALGMLVLQLGSCQLSKQCYQRSFTRFNEQNIEKHINLLQRNHSENLAYLVRKMLDFDNDYRIRLDELINAPELKGCQKISLQKPPKKNQSPYTQSQKFSQQRGFRYPSHCDNKKDNASHDYSSYSRDFQYKNRKFPNNPSDHSITHNDNSSIIFNSREKSFKYLPPLSQGASSKKQVQLKQNRNPEQMLNTQPNYQTRPMFAASRGVANQIRTQIQQQKRSSSVNLQKNPPKSKNYPPPNYLRTREI